MNDEPYYALRSALAIAANHSIDAYGVRPDALYSIARGLSVDRVVALNLYGQIMGESFDAPQLFGECHQARHGHGGNLFAVMTVRRYET